MIFESCHNILFVVESQSTVNEQFSITQKHFDQDQFSPIKKLKKSIREDKCHLLSLGNLDVEAIRSMVSFILDPHVGDIGKLSDLIHRKTLGNPLHIIELLKGAHEEAIIYFSENGDKIGWAWDTTEIDLKFEASENVTDLMIRKLQKVGPETLKLLQIAGIYLI
jgi:predicted ATPase